MGECQGGIRQVDGVFFGPGGPVGELLLSDHQKSLLSGKITIKKITELWKDPPCSSWVNPLFLWAMFNSYVNVYQRVDGILNQQSWSYLSTLWRGSPG